MTADLLCIHPEHVGKVWPLVAGKLRASYLRTDIGHTSDLERAVLTGMAVLWVAVRGGEVEAAAAAQLCRTDRSLVCEIIACGGGKMENWLHHIEAIERWAKAEGAAKCRIIGRRGWLRALKGYRVKSVVLEKEI